MTQNDELNRPWNLQFDRYGTEDGGVIRDSNLEAERRGEAGMSTTSYSPAPWSYEYSPYTVRFGNSPDGVETELPAFEVFDDDGNKVFDTNEDTPTKLQEANARLGSTAPRLLAALRLCADLLADFVEADGPEGDASREAVAAIREATGTVG